MKQNPTGERSTAEPIVRVTIMASVDERGYLIDGYTYASRHPDANASPEFDAFIADQLEAFARKLRTGGLIRLDGGPS